MTWKDYLYMILSIALPVIYTAIKAQNPDIPILENNFIELILWIVGSAINGWEMQKAKIISLLKRKGMTYESLVSK